LLIAIVVRSVLIHDVYFLRYFSFFAVLERWGKPYSLPSFGGALGGATWQCV